ncbi:MAG: acyloxyacyl hydrolase [Bacteroidales bacterium]|nr:acyloxyacyl hydrolase [Bacteroidales bacterium]
MNNYYQTFISSHLNAHLRLGLGYAYAFNKLGSNINFQISLDHFSNAKFYAPNLGINMLTVNLGYTHVLTETLDSNIEDLNKVDEQKDDLKWYYNFNIAGGVKQNFDYDTKHFLIASLYSDAFYKVNEKRALGLGAEFTYDNSIASYYLNSTGEEIDKTFRFGLHLAQDLYFGNIIVYCQVGAYLINPKPADSWIYNRLMLKYPVYKNLLLGIGMKTHTSVADCLQFSVTYRLD